MTTLSGYGTVVRDGEEIEVEVEGRFVKGYKGSWDEPPCGDDLEDLVATRTDNNQKIELTPEEETKFRDSILENYDPADHEPDYED